VRIRPFLCTAGLVGLALGALSLACGPQAAPATPSPTADPFAVVRATAQAAYAAGRADLDRGQLDQALVELDTAKTNDPDNRPDIQQALNETVQRLQALTPTAGTTGAAGAGSTPAPQRTIVVATVPAVAPAISPVAVASASAVVGLVTWRDPQGRFTIDAPATWPPVDPPQSLVGTPVVEFRDPSARAEVDVAIDTSAHAVSPELYAASLELAMQQQVPGYASEQAVPDSLGGSPSLRRVFTFTQHDAAGHEAQARGLQVVVLKGATPYIISATAPAEQFTAPGFGATFDQMLGSFHFS